MPILQTIKTQEIYGYSVGPEPEIGGRIEGLTSESLQVMANRIFR